MRTVSSSGAEATGAAAAATIPKAVNDAKPHLMPRVAAVMSALPDRKNSKVSKVIETF
ncbi:hypothetical protein IHE49_07555 [Rhodanobacter sp. 7MK24]|uniref:hypothetical protein n=1 Tax=Rhodanobacter sp. 7MK24 TaxID=2775922 RepID=UPI001783F620|nr:hypothetical protein [Rhodanobacter sp. 7MK24]MBD8880333.1 hypothetical protein [Rhodanobacter sp. 7MK24]